MVQNELTILYITGHKIIDEELRMKENSLSLDSPKFKRTPKRRSFQNGYIRPKIFK